MTILGRTARLELVVADEACTEAASDYYVRNTDHFAPWTPSRPEGYWSAENLRERLRSAARAFEEGAEVAMFVRCVGRTAIIGDVTLSNVVRGPFQACFLGFGVARDAQGKGLMFEAVQFAIDHAFDRLALHRVMANYMPANVRSGRLLRRLGFRPEGYARDYLKIAGRWEDHILTSKLSPSTSEPGPCVR